MSKGTIIVLVIVGCLLLAIASLALWAALDVFSPNRFGAHVAEGLQSPEATEALAGPIVDRLMAEYPDLPPLAREAAEEVVAWLLQRPAFTPVLRETAALASAAVTTSAQDVVGIDLANSISDVGATVIGVIAALDAEAGANAQAALDASLAASEESGDITHLQMREGHLWGKKDVAIPVSAIEFVDEHTVYLKLDKKAVGALPAVPVKRKDG